MGRSDEDQSFRLSNGSSNAQWSTKTGDILESFWISFRVVIPNKIVGIVDRRAEKQLRFGQVRCMHEIRGEFTLFQVRLDDVTIEVRNRSGK